MSRRHEFVLLATPASPTNIEWPDPISIAALHFRGNHSGRGRFPPPTIHNWLMLQLRSVTKRYASLTALDNVSLDLARGEFFGLLGPNGAGKSTTMSLIAGLRAPDAGTLMLDGQPLTAAGY